MKKIAIFFVLLLTVLPISAQEVDELSRLGFILVGRFSADDFNNVTGFNSNISHSVRVISNPNLGRHDLLISLNEGPGLRTLKYLRIEEQDWDAFEQQMAIVDEKFEKWSQVAAMNNEKDFIKTIPANFENVGYYSVGLVKKYVDTDLYAIFEVKDGRCTLKLSNSEDRDKSSFILYFSYETFHNLYELIKKENAMRNLDLALKAIEQEELQEQAHDALYD